MDMDDVIRFVMKWHGNQKYGSMPYIVHLYAVARHFKTKDYKTIAFLHDIVEDTDITVEDIRNKYGSLISDAIDCLTKREYEDYLSEYIPRVSNNYIATKVKIADLEENIHSAELCYNTKYKHLLPHYYQALEILKFISRDN